MHPLKNTELVPTEEIRDVIDRLEWVYDKMEELTVTGNLPLKLELAKIEVSKVIDMAELWLKEEE